MKYELSTDVERWPKNDQVHPTNILQCYISAKGHLEKVAAPARKTFQNFVNFVCANILWLFLETTEP